MNQTSGNMRAASKAVLILISGTFILIFLSLLADPVIKVWGMQTIIRWAWWGGSFVVSAWASLLAYRFYANQDPSSATENKGLFLILFAAILAATLSLGKFWGFL